MMCLGLYDSGVKSCELECLGFFLKDSHKGIDIKKARDSLSQGEPPLLQPALSLSPFQGLSVFFSEAMLSSMNLRQYPTCVYSYLKGSQAADARGRHPSTVGFYPA